MGGAESVVGQRQGIGAGQAQVGQRRRAGGSRGVAGDNLGQRSRIRFGIGNDLQGAAFKETLHAASAPVGADKNVAPILVDLGPALERKLLVLLDPGNVKGGVPAIPFFAQHDGVFVEIAPHRGVDIGALVEAVHLDQATFGQGVERDLQLGAGAQVVQKSELSAEKVIPPTP